MIQINKIPIQTVDLFNNDGTLIGSVNDLELLDIKIQLIREFNQPKEKLKDPSGLYIMFNDKRYNISLEGEFIPTWPNGLFDKYQRLMAEWYTLKKSKNLF